MRTWLNIESRAIKVLSSHTERQGQESIYTVRDYTVECSRYEYTAISIHTYMGGGGGSSFKNSQPENFFPTYQYLSVHT